MTGKMGMRPVYYNSSKPAQLQALAYTQGTDIHVGPAQEKYLAHEAWHVVQQKQRRVRPTLQIKDGVAINDDAGLEKEADVMGKKALQMRRSDHIATDSSAQMATAVQGTAETRDASAVAGAAIGSPEEKVRLNFLSTAPRPCAPHTNVIQRRIGFEFETDVKATCNGIFLSEYKDPVFRKQGAQWEIHADGKCWEVVTDPVSSRTALIAIMDEITTFVGKCIELRDASKEDIQLGAVLDALKWQGVDNRSRSIDLRKTWEITFGGKPQATLGVPLRYLNRVLHLAEQKKKQVTYKSTSRTYTGGLLSETFPNSPPPFLPAQVLGSVDVETAIKEYQDILIDALKPNALWAEDKARALGDIAMALGFMRLVLRTMKDVSATWSRYKSPDYVKSEFKVMHRTDFHSAYQLLGRMKPFFTVDIVSEITKWSEKELKTTGLRFGGGLSVPSPSLWQWLHSIIDPANIVEHDESKLEAQIVRQFGKKSEEGWKLTPGSLGQKDLFSRGSIIQDSSSMGALGTDMSDPRLPGVPLVVIENRYMGGGVQLPHTSWKTLALEVFRFYEDNVYTPEEERIRKERQRRREEEISMGIVGEGKRRFDPNVFPEILQQPYL
jgi:hypothetical protein